MPVTTSPFLDELAWRGLIHQTTADEPLRAHLAEGPRIAYVGFDPTSDSLHIGNFVPIQLLRHWQRAGHRPIVVMGGGTGLIGDPSGKDRERRLLDREQVEANVRGQMRIFERVLDFDPATPNRAQIVNNLDWLEGLGYIEALRDIGKHFSVNVMIQKESVKQRLHSREQGISYTELSYMVLQAYDFLHLRREMNCTVQMAGSDQYGNIVAGIDLIRRAGLSAGDAAFGVTAPLVTRSDGAKMGKSEKGAVYLTADRTSPYAFYQYWMNVPDADVGSFLRWFTMMEREAIDALVQQQEAAPQDRPGQTALARDLTDLFHGPDERAKVEAASRALFTGDVRSLETDLLDEVFADVPHSEHDRDALAAGVDLVGLLAETTLASSKREAREFLRSGAVAVNGQKLAGDEALDRTLTTEDLLHGRMILLRRGKKKWHATRW